MISEPSYRDAPEVLGKLGLRVKGFLGEESHRAKYSGTTPQIPQKLPKVQKAPPEFPFLCGLLDCAACFDLHAPRLARPVQDVGVGFQVLGLGLRA